MATSLQDLKARCINMSESRLIFSMIDTFEALSTDAENLAAAGVPRMAFIQEHLQATEIEMLVWAEAFLQRLESFERQFLSIHTELARVRREYRAGRGKSVPLPVEPQGEVQADSHQEGSRGEAEPQQGGQQEGDQQEGDQQEGDQQEQVQRDSPASDSAQMRPGDHTPAIVEEPTESAWETSTQPPSPKRRLRQHFRHSWAHFTGRSSRGWLVFRRKVVREE